MKFWNAALRYHAPATIAGFIFFYLISLLLEKDNLLNTQPWLAIVILVIIANFCAYLLHRSSNKSPDERENQMDIRDNKIVGNKVDGSLIMSSGSTKANPQKIVIEGNELNKNTVKGDIVIGAGKVNE